MKKLTFVLALAAGVVIWACNKTTTLPAYTPQTAFQVTAKMSHSKDSIVNSGDTVIFTVQGNINDTTNTYPINAVVRTTDTTGLAAPITVQNQNKIKPAYDTVGMSKNGLFHWKTTFRVIFPPVASKTGIKTTATFTYGLNASSQLGNMVGTDSKFIYVK